MADSILVTVKQVLGVESDYTGFDTDIILGINTALMTLTQLGIGPSSGFTVSDELSKWTDFTGLVENIEPVKSYVCLKTRLMFDPPANSFVVDSINKQLTEIEWRLTVQVDPPYVAPIV